MSLKNIIDNTLEENRNARLAQRARVTKRAEELNAGWAKTLYSRKTFDKIVEPTWGIDDRPHAPFDGYLWENELGEVESYHAGSYLPYITELDNMDKPEYTGDHGWWKIRLTLDMYFILENYGYQIQIQTPYKKWCLEDGTQVCMVKIRAHKNVLEAIQEYSKNEFDELYIKINSSKGSAPEGKLEVVGTIVSVKTYKDFYGVVSKMMVKLENGATVYGTLPKSVPLDYRSKISFTATFENAKNTNTHSFFKRPSKVEML